MEQKIENIIPLHGRKTKPEDNIKKVRQALYNLLRKKIDEQFIELTYLEPRRTLVPEFMEDDVLLGIHKIFSDVFESVLELVDQISIEKGQLSRLEVIIQPSYDSISDIIIINKDKILFRTWEKPHEFVFGSKEGLIDYMFCVFEIISSEYFSMPYTELLEKCSFLEF